MSASNNNAAASGSSSPSSTLSYATYKKTRFVDVPISDKSASFPTSQNSLDVYRSSLLSRITPSVQEQFLGSPIRLTSPSVGTQHESTTRKLRRKAQRAKARKEMIRHIAYDRNIDEHKKRAKAQKIKKPLHSEDAAFDVHCRCPSESCPSHPGDTPNNAIHVDVTDQYPRATLAQRMRSPLHLVAPIFDDANHTVETNLAAIVAIRRWYDALEVQAMMQLNLNPWNKEDERELLEQRINVEIPFTFPTDS